MFEINIALILERNSLRTSLPVEKFPWWITFFYIGKQNRKQKKCVAKICKTALYLELYVEYLHQIWLKFVEYSSFQRRKFKNHFYWTTVTRFLWQIYPISLSNMRIIPMFVHNKNDKKAQVEYVKYNVVVTKIRVVASSWNRTTVHETEQIKNLQPSTISVMAYQLEGTCLKSWKRRLLHVQCTCTCGIILVNTCESSPFLWPV